MGIYTKNGDNGITSLVKVSQVSKADDRIALLGELDELSCALGLVKADARDDSSFLSHIQEILSKLMAGVADQFNAAYKLSTDEVSLLEREIDRLETLFEREKAFVLPGGCKKSAQLDMARAIARRCERTLVSTERKFGGDRTAKQYLNRLSDYLYVAARYADASNGKPSAQTAAPQAQIVQEVLKQVNAALKLNLNTAKKLIEKIEQHASELGMKAVIAICTPDGNPIAVHVMDGAYLVSFDVALKKAYTAVAVKMSTLELGKLAQPGQTFYGIDKLDNGKIVIFGGGVPLVSNGMLIGGLGISGGTGEEDDSLAQYGLSMLPEIL